MPLLSHVPPFPSALPNHQTRPALQLWGGMECTVNRVGDRYFDQFSHSEQQGRLENLDLFAHLGIRALRFPVLWEKTAPHGAASARWEWADEQLGRLRDLHIQPIVGLVHHGSGPRHTSLVDPSFADGLARYARTVAERYPWVLDYTPVNEPLTTARFSGLYGHWYPHGKDELTFARALLNECKAVSMAMNAIREVQPEARLVQTDDLGKTFSTPTLKYQADFENERRWITWDLLCGKVTPDHRMWRHLAWVGINEDELRWFRDHPCPPDIIGVNSYLCSERYLDERTAWYPAHSHGGNGIHAYADVEAVRACADGPTGPAGLLREAWDRYQLPIAITEAHNGCTREEQMRWFVEVWDAADEVRREGADIRAVTAWSLLGAYDWNTLVTCDAGHYEPGIFDLRAPQPRPTALAGVIRDLGMGRRPDHPVLAAPGWWHRSERHNLGFSVRGSADGEARWDRLISKQMLQYTTSRPLLITGVTGTLGRAFARLCELRGMAYRLVTRDEMDISRDASVDAALIAHHPWAVINTAGYVRVDDAERDAVRCERENTLGPVVLAKACARHGIQLVTFSSDLVFDGKKGSPYIESDQTAPLNTYGRSKAEAEDRVLQALPSAMVIRASAFFGPWDEHNFVTLALRALEAGRPFTAASDITITATYVPDLVHAALDLLLDGESGIRHLANPDPITWGDLARRVAKHANLNARLIDPWPATTFNYVARRPAYSALGTERGLVMPSLDDALGRYLLERRAATPEQAAVAEFVDAEARDARDLDPVLISFGDDLASADGDDRRRSQVGALAVPA